MAPTSYSRRSIRSLLSWSGFSEAGAYKAGSLRSRVAADHGGDQIVRAAVGASGGTGDVGVAAGPVEADRGVTQGGHDGGSVAGPGMM
jgi:hypothetical protein